MHAITQNVRCIYASSLPVKKNMCMHAPFTAAHHSPCSPMHLRRRSHTDKEDFASSSFGANLAKIQQSIKLDQLKRLAYDVRWGDEGGGWGGGEGGARRGTAATKLRRARRGGRRRRGEEGHCSLKTEVSELEE